MLSNVFHGSFKVKGPVPGTDSFVVTICKVATHNGYTQLGFPNPNPVFLTLMHLQDFFGQVMDAGRLHRASPQLSALVQLLSLLG